MGANVEPNLLDQNVEMGLGKQLVQQDKNYGMESGATWVLHG